MQFLSKKDFFSLTSKVITDLKKLWSQLKQYTENI